MHRTASDLPTSTGTRSRTPLLRRFAAGVGVLLLLACPPGAGAAEQKASENDLKAAYVFNFGKFVHSANAGAAARNEFAICMIGQDPIGQALAMLTANEQIDGRAVRVVHTREAKEARTCQVAYISSYEGERIHTDLEALRGADVLTVSDAPNFLKLGGMIQFVPQGNHVRFAVNLEAVRRTGLVLSAELLRVAVYVSGAAPGEVKP